ncbi:MAG: thiamine pyrophosphate-dependent dehydrogenase E1 component subunit alpha [Candidatus Atribacteria bacterium]|nr:thiamine pyrophosphate-dependent dehydrogenase E1 component subunit alpha [Candidatus Atribacteria bacterium]
MEILVDRDMLLAIYERMCLIRKYEKRVYYLFLEGVLPGTIHQSHGQEACAVGMLMGLHKDDYVTSTHRPAGHVLAKGVPVESVMAEMFARSNGCCKGKGGSMHLGDISYGAVPSIAIVGGGLPVAVGIGLSCKMRRTRNVVVCFFGDGASNEGSFHESLNGAAIWNCPVIFACENNFYGASTHVSRVMKVKNIADRACAYGIPGEVVDGNDVLKVYDAASRAIQRAREGDGPTLLELQTYRMGGHSRNDACHYRDKQEEKEWLARDPIVLYRDYLIRRQVVDASVLEGLEQKIDDRIEQAVMVAQSSPSPQPEDALRDVYWEGGN